MESPLQDKVVLITGGARRVGAAITRKLHNAGANVVIHYHRSVNEAHALSAQLNAARPTSATPLGGDLLDSEGAVLAGRGNGGSVWSPRHSDQQCVHVLSHAGGIDHRGAVGRPDGHQPQGAAVPVAGRQRRTCRRARD